MTNKTQSTTRHYIISNKWLEEYEDDKTKYVDILEIRFDPENSQYLSDLVTMGIIKESERITERTKASFIDNATLVGETGFIKSIRMDDTYTDRQPFVGGVLHPIRFRRIYAHGTTARYISFEGFGSI